MKRQDKSQKAEFLLSKDGKTLIRFTKLDLTKDTYAETMNKISLADRPVRGNPDAKVTIVNFDDFECPFCARMHTTLMTEILPQYKDKIKIVYKDYPLLQMHPWAQRAANDANCLAKESGTAYWQLADYLHANQHADQCVTAESASCIGRDRSADHGVRQAERGRLAPAAGMSQGAVGCGREGIDGGGRQTGRQRHAHGIH